MGRGTAKGKTALAHARVRRESGEGSPILSRRRACSAKGETGCATRVHARRRVARGGVPSNELPPTAHTERGNGFRVAVPFDRAQLTCAQVRGPEWLPTLSLTLVVRLLEIVRQIIQRFRRHGKGDCSGVTSRTWSGCRREQ
jgi:hypothetical protein